MTTRLVFSASVGCVLFFTALSTSAQTIDFTIERDVLAPRANESVQYRVVSDTFDVERADIEWLSNDTLVSSGVGRVVETIVTGPVGQEHIIKVTVTPPGEATMTETITLFPGDVVLLWEALTYTPPHYKGKALPTSGALVSITAIPELMTDAGTTLPAKDLIFTWEQDGFVLGNASGFGKQRIAVPVKELVGQTTHVRVTVTSARGTYTVSNDIFIKTYAPGIVFYEDHPLRGVLYNHALLNTFRLIEEEVTLRAEPYHFSLEDVDDGDLRYRWKINGVDVDIPREEQRNNLVLRHDGSEGGSSDVTVAMDNYDLDHILQEAIARLTITF